MESGKVVAETVSQEIAGLLAANPGARARDQLRRAAEAWNDGRDRYARLLLGKAKATISKAAARTGSAA